MPPASLPTTDVGTALPLVLFCWGQNFPYFHVSWKGGGYAHVIEDEAEWNREFGMEVCTGMMDMTAGRFGRRGNGRGRNDYEAERREVLSFLKDWEPFDWTQELDGGQY